MYGKTAERSRVSGHDSARATATTRSRWSAPRHACAAPTWVDVVEREDEVDQCFAAAALLQRPHWALGEAGGRAGAGLHFLLQAAAQLLVQPSQLACREEAGREHGVVRWVLTRLLWPPRHSSGAATQRVGNALWCGVASRLCVQAACGSGGWHRPGAAQLGWVLGGARGSTKLKSFALKTCRRPPARLTRVRLKVSLHYQVPHVHAIQEGVDPAAQGSRCAAASVGVARRAAPPCALTSRPCPAPASQSCWQSVPRAPRGANGRRSERSGGLKVPRPLPLPPLTEQAALCRGTSYCVLGLSLAT